MKYKKVTDLEVLERYYRIQSLFYSRGIWMDYLSVKDLADELETSKYQIRKALKKLKEQEYVKIEKYPTYTEEYDNGLYTENIPILFTRVYRITQKGCKLFEEIDRGKEL